MLYPLPREITGRTGAVLRVLHSIEKPYSFAPVAEEIKQNVRAKVEQLFENMSDDIKQDKKYTSIKVKTYIQARRVIYSLIEEARALDIGLIVMGTKGRSGL